MSTSCQDSLELVVDTYADDIVCAGVGLGGSVSCAVVTATCGRVARGDALGVVAVDRDEVTSVQTQLLRQVQSAAQTDAVAVAGKRRVLLVLVGETVVGTLAAETYRQQLVNIVLSTQLNLVGTAGELFLSVVSHFGVLIVEEVVLSGGAQLRCKLIASG